MRQTPLLISTQFSLPHALIHLYTLGKNYQGDFPIWFQSCWFIFFFFDRKTTWPSWSYLSKILVVFVTEDRELNWRSWNPSLVRVTPSVSRTNSICIHGNLWKQICFVTISQVYPDECLRNTAHPLFHLGTIACNFPHLSRGWSVGSFCFALSLHFNPLPMAEPFRSPW